METAGSTVLALIDERLCSLASVRQAAELARERSAQLLVVPVKSGTSLFAQFCALYGAVHHDD
jgi:K+-sensing histidine kinase KdpD